MTSNTETDDIPVPKMGELALSNWPEACLVKNEKKFISILIGNSNLHWATHGYMQPAAKSPISENCNPNLFWNTPHLLPEEVEIDLDEEGSDAGGSAIGAKVNEELLNTLCRHIPQKLSDYLFGFVTVDKEPKRRPQTLKSAYEQNKFRGHLPTFYIVSTNAEQETYLARTIGSIPCRMYKLQGHDFFTESQGAYKGMGVDRLANLYGAMSCSGAPSLVIDGGTALTYTALGSDGKIMGGGISPGFEMRMRALNEFTSGLPRVDVAKYIQELEQLEFTPTVFGEDTERAMVVALLNEMYSSLMGVIQSWKHDPRVKNNPKKRKSTADENGKPLVNEKLKVTLTGGSASTLFKLLDKSNDLLDTVPPFKKDFHVEYVNGMQHFGIAALLCERSKRDYSKPNIADGKLDAQKEDASSKKSKMSGHEIYNKYVGEKIAKEFEDPDEDGDHLYRGQVLSYFVYDNGEPYFRVVYTDGDEEDINLDELKSKCNLSNIHFGLSNLFVRASP